MTLRERQPRQADRQVSTPADGDRRRRMREAKTPEALALADMPTEVRSEVMRLMSEVDALKAELNQARERVHELETMADEDPLLPMLNRRGFVRELERALAYMKRHGTTDSLIYCDLNEFKAINDTHGHAAGDAALRRVAELLIQQLRRSDIVGRLGGDEFAIVLRQADASAAERKAAQLAERLATDSFVHQGVSLELGMTAGATQLEPDDTVQSALDRADRLMYARKQAHAR